MANNRLAGKVQLEAVIEGEQGPLHALALHLLHGQDTRAQKDPLQGRPCVIRYFFLRPFAFFRLPFFGGFRYWSESVDGIAARVTMEAPPYMIPASYPN